MTAGSGELRFDGDAMLMYGWLAKPDFEIEWWNAALSKWMGEHRMDLPTSSILDAVNTLKGQRLELTEFLGLLFQDSDKTVGGIIEDRLADIRDNLSCYVRNLQGNKPNIEREKKGDYSVVRTITLQITLRGERHLLAGVRVVKPGGLKLRGGNEQDRVDLINVCLFENKGQEWSVRGFQGQLQEAWTRVAPVIREGTKSGAVSLMSRNLSHNIGSHALFWLEQDEESEGGISEKTLSAQRMRFYQYLRERMELAAGFATSVPLSANVAQVSEILEEFKKNTLFWQRICRSEKVHDVEIQYLDDGAAVALPGGSIGKQALYTILENIIRDSAKYERNAGGVLQISVRVEELEDAQRRSDYLKVTVECLGGNRGKGAYATVRAALADLRIADESGRLLAEDWGVKERFICAALLRGVRPEDIPLAGSENDSCVHLRLGDTVIDGLKILDAELPNGNLAWVFYLMKPKSVLLIDSQASDNQTLQAGIDLHTMGWLRDSIAKPSEIRHEFVVVCPRDEGEMDWLNREIDKLPYRVFVSSGQGKPTSNTWPCTPLDAEMASAGRLSLKSVYRKWLAELLNRKGLELADLPMLLFGSRSGKLRLTWTGEEFKFERISEEEFKELMSNPRVAGLFDRHGSNRDEWGRYRKGTLPYYEPHQDPDPLTAIVEVARPPEVLPYILVEGVLTKVLVVDERFEPATLARQYRFSSGGLDPATTYHDLFHWKGIEIKGAIYSSEGEIPDEKPLLGWLKDGAYDFVLVHRGILDKLRAYYGLAATNLYEMIYATLRPYGHLIVHSGRMGSGERHEGVKFLPLSNVAAWFGQNHAKIQIVEELNRLRQV